MESTTVDSMCRCCAAEGLFKDIKTSYHWMGEEEVYGDMLRECFDVKLAMIEQGGICEVCITQLRNATNFKKQVQHTEKKFKRQLDSGRFKATEVKEEVSGEERAHSSDENDQDVDNDNVDDEDYMPDFEIPIKTESPEEKSRKRGAKASTSRAKRSRLADDADKMKCKRPAVKKARKRIITIALQKPPRVKIVSKASDELSKHLANTRTLVACSNATPIRRYGGGGYTCCFCAHRCPQPAQLKTHTLQSHVDTEKSNFWSTQTLPSFVIKLDITGLRCSLCQHPCESIDDLVSHLTTSHSRTYHTDIKSHIIPFKFDEPLRCALCSEPHSNFKTLREHMNTHFRNHICDVCGRGFVNNKVFLTHMYRHNTGVFNCTVCAKVFDTRVKCREHEQATHVKLNRRSKCGYCGERFSDYTKKNQHEVKLHGAKPSVLPCLACDKTFDNQRALTVHTKTHHLMEKRAPK